MLTVIFLNLLSFLSFGFLFLIIKDSICSAFKAYFSFFYYLFIILFLKILIYTLKSCRFTFNLIKYINRNFNKENIIFNLIKNL